MDETNTDALRSGIDELVALCARLAQENRMLREEQAGLRIERAKLVERNELAKSKIDAMIARLRSLDEPLPGGQRDAAPASAAADEVTT